MAGYGTITKTGQAVKDRLVRQFGDEAAVQLTDADVIRYVNDGQREIAVRNRLLKGVLQTNLVAGQRDYPASNLVLKVVSMLVNGSPVEYRSFEEAEEYLLSTDPKHANTGQPIIWYEWGGTYTFWPVPDTNVTNGIEIRYIGAPTEITALSDSLSIPDAMFNILVQYCTAQAYEMDEDWSAAQIKNSQFETSLLTAHNDQEQTSQKTYGRITVLEDDM